MLGWFFDSPLNPYLLEGAIISIGLTIGSLLIGLLIGVGIALMRLSGKRILSFIAVFYCWFFRGTPLLVQLLITYTGLPLIGLRFDVWEAAGRWGCIGCKSSAWWSGRRLCG